MFYVFLMSEIIFFSSLLNACYGIGVLWLKMYFGLLLFPVVLVMYIRYRQIGEYYRGYALPPVVVRHNKIALWIGLLSCFGLSLVANFQETNVIVVHLTGAFLCFGLGTVYIWLQVSIHGMVISCICFCKGHKMKIQEGDFFCMMHASYKKR